MKTMKRPRSSEMKSRNATNIQSKKHMKAKLWILLFAFFVVFPSISQEVPDTSTIENVVETAIANDVDTLRPNEGFSTHSLWRGILGMAALILIAFLFSSNRKAINWKTVGIGLTIQLLIAIGVLKISFIQAIFEGIGKVFVSILDFTRAGSQFLFEGLVADMNTFGYIFAFQVLPTIIFFSALTSVLFYLGIIQKVVKALAWLLSKALQISGAESLSSRKYLFRPDRGTTIN